MGACARTMNAHLDAVKKIDKRSIVILSSMGPVYLDGTTFNGKDEARVTGLGVELISNYAITSHYEVFEIGMRETLNELSKNPNLNIIFALDIPELGIDQGCGSLGKNLFILLCKFLIISSTLGGVGPLRKPPSPLPFPPGGAPQGL